MVVTPQLCNSFYLETCQSLSLAIFQKWYKTFLWGAGFQWVGLFPGVLKGTVFIVLFDLMVRCSEPF